MADESPLPTVPELSSLSKAVEFPGNLASGSHEIQNVALAATKYIFDLSLKSEDSSLKHVNDLLASITPSQAPITRSQTRSAPQAVPSPSFKSLFKPTPLTSLFTDNLDEDQIWAQLDIRTKHMCEVLDIVLEGELPEDDEAESSMEGEDELQKALQQLREEGVDFYDESDSENEDSEGDSEKEEADSEEDEGSDEGSIGEDGEESMANLGGGSSEEEEEYKQQAPSRTVHRKRQRGITSELDDGFFNLSSFKVEIEKAEARSSSRGRLADDEDEDSDDSDQVLGSIDIFAPIEGDGDIDDSEADKELFYSDFFETPMPSATQEKSKFASAPPGSRVRFNDEVRVKKIKSSGKGRPLQVGDTWGQVTAEDTSGSDKVLGENEEDYDMEYDDEGLSEEDGSKSNDEAGRETIERLRDDLFADDDDDAQDMTTHEKRLFALKEQIAELETDNVSKKHWTLMGEAGSRARPQNSLLEEDLEFERVMKPTPVITEELVQSLEGLIKARILENRFDDVVRIRPVDDKLFLPSRLLELNDSKSTQSLAQIYENEYMAAQSDGSTIDDRDGKLKREHDEIMQQWDKICSKLDAPSNAHFVPKLPKTLISTVANVLTATMESALPTMKSAASMLAPEEVFSAQTSQPRSRTELAPSEKRALRVKERKAKRKQRSLLDKTVDKVAKMRGIGGVKKQKQVALESIVKHGKGVTVVGKAAQGLKPRSKLPNKKRS